MNDKNEILVLENDKLALAKDFAEDLRQFEILYQAMVEKRKEIANALLKAMNERNITKLDNEVFNIFTKKATTKENFDKKKFQEEHPDLYDKYVSFGKVKESITIKIKETNDE